MRITSVNIPASYLSDIGLNPIEMNRLGKIVILAGKNGSGKTRILNTLKRLCKESPAIEIYKEYKLNVDMLSRLKSKLSNSSSLNPGELHYIQQNVNQIQEYLSTDKFSYIKIKDSYLTFSDKSFSSENHSLFFDLRLSNLDCQSPNVYNKQESQRSAQTIDHNSYEGGYYMNSVGQNAYKLLQSVSDQYFESSHQDNVDRYPEKYSESKNNLDKLNSFLFSLLNTHLTRDYEGDALLFNRKLGNQSLSEGQKALLQICILFFMKKDDLSKYILIFDEPENHLHPEAVIEILTRLDEVLVDGQIWIATHSIPLIAHFPIDSLWHVENGSVSFAGKYPEKVISSLIGDENEVQKLQKFIDFPDQYALTNFAYESLFKPTSLLTNSNDAQSHAVGAVIQKIFSGKSIKLLDYGAGKGRILANIFEESKEFKNRFLNQWQYIAFNIEDASDGEICKQVISSVYGDYDKKYYRDMKSLLSDHSPGSFDLVLLCNVLHEINIHDWNNLFLSSGIITNLLNDNGYVLLFEDTLIPHGENANDYGFLILDTPQIRALFNITDQDKDFKYFDARNDGRLKAQLIPKRFLTTISSESRKKCLELLIQQSETSIKEIRKEPGTYSNGRKHAFWTQQYVNAQLALKAIK